MGGADIRSFSAEASPRLIRDRAASDLDPIVDRESSDRSSSQFRYSLLPKMGKWAKILSSAMSSPLGEDQKPASLLAFSGLKAPTGGAAISTAR
jgi:hypothetical protein